MSLQLSVLLGLTRISSFPDPTFAFAFGGVDFSPLQGEEPLPEVLQDAGGEQRASWVDL